MFVSESSSSNKSEAFEKLFGSCKYSFSVGVSCLICSFSKNCILSIYKYRAGSDFKRRYSLILVPFSKRNSDKLLKEFSFSTVISKSSITPSLKIVLKLNTLDKDFSLK